MTATDVSLAKPPTGTGSNGSRAGATTVTPPPPSGGARRRVSRRPRDTTRTDLLVLAACAVSAICANWLVFARFTDGVGWFGFLVTTYLTFLVVFYFASAERLGRLVAKDRVATVVVFSIGVVVLVPLVSLIAYIVVRGVGALRVAFFTDDQRGITPVLPATEGGGAHAIVGTLEQVGLALLWSLPLALAAAVFLNESRSKWRRVVRITVDAMSGLPSVVAGLFIFATLILPNAQSSTLFNFNGFMASLALAITMVPTITRTIEVVLRLVPDGLREASLAMGASRARTVWSVVFPTARSGMVTAVVLGIARAVGETAPLLFTAFGYDLMNANPFSGPQESLPLFVYRNIRKPDLTSIDRGFVGALVLMVLVLTLFVIARVLGRERKGRSRRWSPFRPGRRSPSPSHTPDPAAPSGPTSTLELP